MGTASYHAYGTCWNNHSITCSVTYAVSCTRISSTSVSVDVGITMSGSNTHKAPSNPRAGMASIFVGGYQFRTFTFGLTSYDSWTGHTTLTTTSDTLSVQFNAASGSGAGGWYWHISDTGYDTVDVTPLKNPFSITAYPSTSTPYSASVIISGKGGTVISGSYSGDRSGDFSGSSFTVYGLYPSSSYSLRVTARSANGETASDYVTVETRAEPRPDPPSAYGSPRLSSTLNSITVDASSNFSRGTGYINTYKYTIGSQTYLSSSTNYTATGLTPDTNYYVSVSCIDSNNYSAGPVTGSIRTKAPVPPVLSSVDVIVLDSFRAKFTIGNVKFTSPSYLSHFEYRTNGGSWSRLNSTIKEIDTLKPETSYTLEVRAVDNFGYASNVISKEFKTPTDQAKIWLKQDGVYKIGKVWVKQDGQWVKAKGVYVKEDGSWKKGK